MFQNVRQSFFPTFLFLTFALPFEEMKDEGISPFHILHIKENVFLLYHYQLQY